MKRIVLLSLSVLVVASTAFAQNPGTIKIFNAQDPTSDCRLTDAPGVVTAYVYHVGSDGTTASQWALQSNGGAALTWLADTNQFPLVIGNTQSGIAFSYGACLSGDIHLTNVLYSGAGLSTPCSTIDVVNDPNAPSGNIEGVDCSAVKVFPAGEGAIIGGDNATCPCVFTPVETKSWGAIKALYE